jgi:membrane protein
MASMEFDQSLQSGPSVHKAVPRPSIGWKNVLLKTFREAGKDRVTLIAGGVTYFLLLALFPSVTAFISIYGLFVDPAAVGTQLDLLTNVIPAGGLEIIQDQLLRVTEQGKPALGVALAISLAIALWSASSGVKAMFEAMSVAYDETEKRNFFALNAVALCFTLAGVVAAAVTLSVVVAIPAVLGVVGLSSGVEWIVQIGGYVVMVLILLMAIAALYRFGPSPRAGMKWRWITPGAVLAIVAIGVVSALFSWYASNVGHFDKTYGSLGALLGFMFWMWVCLIAVIAGAELNSVLNEQSISRLDQKGAAQKSEQARNADLKGLDHPSERSSEWMEGYRAARAWLHQPQARVTLAGLVPALLAVAILSIGRRSQR